jgi:hypothetical protein
VANAFTNVLPIYTGGQGQKRDVAQDRTLLNLIIIGKRRCIRYRSPEKLKGRADSSSIVEQVKEDSIQELACDLISSRNL